LWNLFMPPRSGHTHVDDSFEFCGAQLGNLEYALCAEEMGHLLWASEIFNCSAPDTGNMEVLHRYGTREQKERWLKPLMDGEIRSAFLMTEPDVASSDATNIRTSIRREGDEYVINGVKWWSSGAGDPRCKIAIVMGKSAPEAPRQAQQSMVLVPLDAPGVKILRHLPVFGYDDAPHGHMEVALENVRISASDMLLGKRIADHSVWEERVARARIDIEMSRLLCLKAADMMDRAGNKAAQNEIAMVKVQAPSMALKILDDAVQAHGGAGVSEDFRLAKSWAAVRTLRLADGPDEVHNRAIARAEFKRYEEYAVKRPVQH
jgi:acyl-CoA dehydrogenase